MGLPDLHEGYQCIRSRDPICIVIKFPWKRWHAFSRIALTCEILHFLCIFWFGNTLAYDGELRYFHFRFRGFKSDCPFALFFEEGMNAVQRNLKHLGLARFSVWRDRWAFLSDAFQLICFLSDASQPDMPPEVCPTCPMLHPHSPLAKASVYRTTHHTFHQMERGSLLVV